MIHDLTVPASRRRAPDGHAQFGTITAGRRRRARGDGRAATTTARRDLHDRRQRRAASRARSDHFPDVQTNVVPIQLSMGAYNALQQSDAHAYWEFNYTTNWIHPLYELPFTGGIPGSVRGRPDRRAPVDRPGPGPSGTANDPVAVYGDNPYLPRDPDKFDGTEQTTRSASSASASSRAVSPTRSSSTSTSALASFEPGTAVPAAALRRLRGRGRARRPERRRRHLGRRGRRRLARPTASTTTRACSSRRRRSTASR